MAATAQPPRFVLSYSRRDGDRWLDRFFRDLRKEIAIREGLDDRQDNHEPGYRDVDSIPSGVDWSDALAEALAKGWACVSLYTPSYFRREACGKELQVFLDRAGVKYGADGVAQGARGILPVLWASREDLGRHGLPPGVVSRINFRASKHQDRYEREGLRWILQRSPRAAYLDILHDIVRDLIQSFPNRPPELPQRPAFDEVKNAFALVQRVPAQSSGPDTLAVYLISDDHTESTFAMKRADSWISLLEEEMPNIRIDAKSVDPKVVSAGNLISLLEASTRNNSLVFVVVDPETAGIHHAEVLKLLREIVAADKWSGDIVAPGGNKTLANAVIDQLRLDHAQQDRISLSISDSDVQAFVRILKQLMPKSVNRIVNAADVKRRAPGGGRPAEKPRISGPVERDGIE